MEPIRLSPEEINRIDELEIERKSLEHTMEVAINFAGNKLYRNRERWREFWKEAAEHYGFDLKATDYILKNVDGFTCIVEHNPTEAPPGVMLSVSIPAPSWAIEQPKAEE
jgi:hypothetical protein